MRGSSKSRSALAGNVGPQGARFGMAISLAAPWEYRSARKNIPGNASVGTAKSWPSQVRLPRLPSPLHFHVCDERHRLHDDCPMGRSSGRWDPDRQGLWTLVERTRATASRASDVWASAGQRGIELMEVDRQGTFTAQLDEFLVAFECLKRFTASTPPPLVASRPPSGEMATPCTDLRWRFNVSVR